MSIHYGDGTIRGVVYEEDGRFFYECEHCCTSFSGSDEYRLELKADEHDQQYHQNNAKLP